MEKMFTTDADYFNEHYVFDLNSNKPKSEFTDKQKKEFE